MKPWTIRAFTLWKWPSFFFLNFQISADLTFFYISLISLGRWQYTWLCQNSLIYIHISQLFCCLHSVLFAQFIIRTEMKNEWDHFSFCNEWRKGMIVWFLDKSADSNIWTSLTREKRWSSLEKKRATGFCEPLMRTTENVLFVLKCCLIRHLRLIAVVWR